ncbi:FliM/FliN family flagellar motor switch protein [Thalassoglobus sp. JC818]|uniref:FliM/FliN family flagellar motor switch protein n=1 Tax=Thalassoglobus sp. JC818 TaxID=3232136 RepID=UPI00345A467E
MSTETFEATWGMSPEDAETSETNNVEESPHHRHNDDESWDASDSRHSIAEIVPQLQIPLTFEVGKSEATVDQLRSMSVGYIFELSTHVEKPVVIKAYGQTIGKGELLDINGRLGVRLTEGPSCGNV